MKDGLTTSFPPAIVRVFVHRFQGQVSSVRPAVSRAALGRCLALLGRASIGSLGKRLLVRSQALVPSLWAFRPTEHSRWSCPGMRSQCDGERDADAAWPW